MIFNVVNKSSNTSPLGTAVEKDVLEGKTFYSGGLEMVGTMPKVSSEYVIENIDDKISIPEGYHDGSEIAKLSEDNLSGLVPENIKEGIKILGVNGKYTAEYGSNSVGDLVLPITASTNHVEGEYGGTELEGSFWLEAGSAYVVEYKMTRSSGRRSMCGILIAYDLGDNMVGLFSYGNEYTYPLVDPDDESYGRLFILQGGTMDSQGVITPDESKSGIYIKRGSNGTTVTLGNITLSDFGTNYQNKVIEVDQGTTVISYDKFIKQSSDPVSPGEYVTSFMIDTSITPPKVLFDDFVELFYWRADNDDYYSYGCSYNEFEEGKGFYFIGCTEIIFDSVYVNSDTMTLEEVQEIFSQMGLELDHFGWQKDNISINAYIDGVNRQDIWSGFISRSNKYVYQKYDGLESVTVTSKGVQLQERDVEIFENEPIELTPDASFAGFNKVRIYPSIVAPESRVHVKVLSLNAKDTDAYGIGYIIYFDTTSGKYVGTWVKKDGFIEMDVPSYSIVFICTGGFYWKGPELVGELNLIVNKMVYDEVEYGVNGLHATQDTWICLTPEASIPEEPPEEYLPYNHQVEKEDTDEN